ncbi:hypothetical protein AVEN_255131-1 [Araneus ventricosus]|uniref:Uncharacterized protein n=1 Tax=Araneus ventricosus TaxID=182803 RepID=A0A4Y2BAA1_ARAVE|nr:hypothetical protein AVEN_255131-1 [Araneus ventricosus]
MKAENHHQVSVKRGAIEVYVSKWFAFERMRFLLDEDEPTNTIDSPIYVKNFALSTKSLFYVEHFKEVEMLLTTQSHDLRKEDQKQQLRVDSNLNKNDSG